MTKETAMKILKELHDNSLFSNRIALETLIPELADSNDERIRKCLIDFFEDWHENKSHCWGIAVTAILAWLEKQGESYTKKDVDDAYLKGICDAKHELKQQDEYELVAKKVEDEIEIPFGAKDSELQEATYYIPKGFHAEVDDDKVVINKSEKSAEWSDEDEENLQNCIGAIWAADYYLYEDKQEMEVWLKSIKNRIGG